MNLLFVRGVICLSKEYFREDGSRITVTDDNLVFDSNGYVGQINQFGEFVPQNSSESYKIFGNGNIVGSNGNSGNIVHGKYIKMENLQNEDTVISSSSSGTLDIPLWIKLLVVFVVIPILGSLSIFSIFSMAIFLLVYEEFQNGNWIPLIIFIVVFISLIALVALLVIKVVKLLKNKKK